MVSKADAAFCHICHQAFSDDEIVGRDQAFVGLVMTHSAVSLLIDVVRRCSLYETTMLVWSVHQLIGPKLEVERRSNCCSITFRSAGEYFGEVVWRDTGDVSGIIVPTDVD